MEPCQVRWWRGLLGGTPSSSHMPVLPFDPWVGSIIEIKMVLCLSQEYQDTCLESTITILPFISPDWSGKSTVWIPPSLVILWRIGCTAPRRCAKMIVVIINALAGKIIMCLQMYFWNWPLQTEDGYRIHAAQINMYSVTDNIFCSILSESIDLTFTTLQEGTDRRDIKLDVRASRHDRGPNLASSRHMSWMNLQQHSLAIQFQSSHVSMP